MKLKMTMTMKCKEQEEEESSKFYKMSPSHHHHHHHDDEERQRRNRSGKESLSLLLSTSSSSPSWSSSSFSSGILYKNLYIYVLIFLLHLSTQISTVSSFAYQNRVHIASLGGGTSSSGSGSSVSNINNNNNNFNFGGAGGLGLGDRQGCSWIKSNANSNTNSNTNNNNNNDQLKKLECHLRTINVDLWNVNGISNSNNNNPNDGNSNWTQQLSRQEFERATSIKLKCNEKLFFDSFLQPNQTLFSLINLRGVEIEHCKIRRLPGNVWTTLGFLKTLSITSHNSDWAPSVTLELENEAFEGLGQLEHLNLAYNNIFAIPERLFCPLRSLNKLNLSNNRLSELEELNWSSERGQYCTLGVQHVDLSFNSLRRLGKIVKWKKIQELRLQNNLIEELDDAAFAELSGMKMVNMSSNRLVAVPPSIFKFNGHVREIYLANNSISALAPAVFAGLEQLVLLDLSRNTLTSQWIRDKMFHGLSRLIVLRLSSNQLSYIDGSIFKDLVSLQSLSLDNNRIETIHPDAFTSLHNLHLLLLTNNRITSLDSRVFSHLFVLRQLFLDHNKLRGLEDHLFVNCTSLQDLGLADNLLQEVPIALRYGLKSIQTLDIGENRITSLTNDSFSGLNSLFGLRMVDNRLTDLPRGFCDSLQKLRVLNLAQNRVQRISPSAFTNCQEIRALRLDTNMLEELPDSLVPQLPNLLWLNVSENRLKSVDYRAIPVGTEWLDLSHNQIETISGFVDESVTSVSASGSGSANNNNNRKAGPIPIVPQLRVLDLSYNKLSSLDYTSFPGSLDTLRVNHNKVTTVAPDTFIRSYNLRRVELVGNQMETLSLTSLRFPPLPRDRGLPEFYLGRNPWSCSCSMEWLLRANTNNNNENNNSSPRIVDLDDITCTPVFSRNQSLISMRDHQIQSSDFLCPYSSHCFQLCYCCEYEACDCNMQCPDQCNCYHDFSWGRNVVDCSSSNQVEVPANSPMDATEIYLDGNNIRELKSHSFIGKKHTRELFLNNSRIEFIRNKTFNGLKSLNSLHLEDNLLTELQGYEFADIENVRELYLGNNLIKSIAPETFTMLKSLEVLRLDGNLLMSVNVWELNGHGGLRSLTLSDNPWSCNCEFIIAFRSWIFSHSMIVKDLTLTTCRMVTSSSDQQSDKVLNNNNNNNNNVNTAISTICHGPSEKLVNNIGNVNFNMNSVPSSVSSSPSGQFNVNDNILSDEHEHSSSVNDGDDDDNDHHDNNNSNNVNSDLSKSMVVNGGVSGSDSGIFWTILVAVIGLLLILLVLIILFRKEIYDRVNNKMNLYLFFSSFLCCCCGSARCCRDGAAGGRNDVKSNKNKSKNKKSSGHHHSNGVGVGDDTEKLFDAYFLYGKRDEELILEKLTPELEHRVPNFFRLCLHYRDLCLNPQNPWNPEMIMSACDASKRVVLVLSQVFLQMEWSNPEIRASIQFVLSRPEVQKKLIVILLPPLTEHHLTAINFKLNANTNHHGLDSLPLPGFPDLAMNINMANNNSSKLLGIGASLLKSSVLEYNTDPNFWSKFKLLLPTPLHSSMSHSADHPMLIPATYTISRSGHGQGEYNNPSDRHNISHHSNSSNGHSQTNSRNNLIPPSYETHSLNYANASSLHPLQNQHHLPNNPPPPPSLLWQTTAGLKDHPNATTMTMTMPMPSQIQLQNRGVLPIPTAPLPNPNGVNPNNSSGPFPSFNESFRRHQQAHLNQQQHQHQQLRQAKRQSNSNSHHRNHNNHHNHNHHLNHSHEHQNSNCSNISNNSRQPLHGSAGYSSSVETNLSSSNEELDHVYSTLDSPMHSPSAHHNHNHNHNHTSSSGMNNFNNSCRGPSQCNNCTCSGVGVGLDNPTANNINCPNGPSVNNNNNIPIQNPNPNNEQCNNKNNGSKLINPYSPTNINNNGDPTMYFV